jgi:hypothetical protein
MPPELPRSMRAKNDFPVVRISVDDRDYDLPLGEVTSNIAREVRQAAGRSLSKVIAEAETDGDIDTIAVLVFAARRVAGEQVTFAEVESSISYGSGFGVEMGEGDDSGEVPAAS